MSDHGLYVLNEALALQIDGTNPIFSLIDRGVITPNVGLLAQTFTISKTSSHRPRLALRAVNCYAAIHKVRKSGNTYTWTIFCINATTGPSITWFYYDKPPIQPRTSGWGIEAYDGNGHVIFSDIYPTMKIIDILPGGNRGIDKTYPTGRSYAVYAPRMLWENYVQEVGDTLEGPPQYIVYTGIGGWRWSGTTLLTDMRNDENLGVDVNGDMGGGPSCVLVLDVTNV